MSKTDNENADRTATSRTPAAGRRRLIKGAVGALPAVFTLSSGAQTAAQSLACWQKPVDLADPQRFTAQPDGWLRHRVVDGTNPNGEVYCTSTQVPWNDSDDSLYLTCADVDGNPNLASTWVEGSGISVPPSDVTPTARTSFVAGTNPRYGLVFVDNQGQVISLDNASGVTTQPLTQSCWLSMPLSGGAGQQVGTTTTSRGFLATLRSLTGI